MGAVKNHFHEEINALPEPDEWGHKGTYRGYRIEYDPKPIPASCGVDWSFVHQDYDGPEDRRCGCAASESACREEIDMLEDER